MDLLVANVGNITFDLEMTLANQVRITILTNLLKISSEKGASLIGQQKRSYFYTASVLKNRRFQNYLGSGELRFEASIKHSLSHTDIK
jgi:hypothetical protein